MNHLAISHRPFLRFVCLLLATVTAAAPSTSVMAQTFGAQQAVRQRVEGIGSPEELRQEPPVETPPYRQESAPSAAPAGGSIDTTYIAPSAVAIIVLRPAQIMAAPIAELLPTEVATAAGLQYLGIAPADVDELVAFTEMPGPTGWNYGVTVKFNKPFRGSSIPPHARPMVQLSELAGRKYLQSAHPVMPSFYGTSSTTLIAAPDAMLRQLVEAAGQSKSGPLFDRVRNEPAGSDFVLAVDIASLRPMIEMGLPPQLKEQLPPEAQPLFEALNLIGALKLTLNPSGSGPTSLVVHANDDAAAQQLESIIQKARQQLEAAAATDAAAADPIAQAFAQYKERMSRPFTPQRNGADITLFQLDGEDPAHQQLVESAAAIAGIALATARSQMVSQGMQGAEVPQEGDLPPGDFQSEGPSQPQEQLK